MKALCLACGRDDFPETEQWEADTSIRGHLRLFHPGEWFTVELGLDEVLIAYPSKGTCEPGCPCVRCAQRDGAADG